MLLDETIRVGKGRGAPGSIGSKAVILVEQDALRTFQEHSARLREDGAYGRFVHHFSLAREVAVDINAVFEIACSSKNGALLPDLFGIWEILAESLQFGIFDVA